MVYRLYTYALLRSIVYRLPLEALGDDAQLSQSLPDERFATKG